MTKRRRADNAPLSHAVGRDDDLSQHHLVAHPREQGPEQRPAFPFQVLFGPRIVSPVYFLVSVRQRAEDTHGQFRLCMVDLLFRFPFGADPSLLFQYRNLFARLRSPADCKWQFVDCQLGE